ncbi:hypothetical protein GCM10027168_05520 [Streptomyces capparidis]
MPPPDFALLESRSLRESVRHRVETLDKVKVLATLPDGLHVTSEMVAEYFEVPEITIRQLVARHREELQDAGYTLLKGSDLQSFLSLNMSLRKIPGRGLAVFPRRAVLNVAMLLRDSEVARKVRAYLLDAEQAHRTEAARDSIEAIVVRLAEEAAERVTAPAFAEVNLRLDAHGRVICAMSERLCRLGEDMREMRRDMADMRHDMAEFRRDLAEIRTTLARGQRRPRHRR